MILCYQNYSFSLQLCEQYPPLGGILSQVPRLLDPKSAHSIDNEWRLLPIYHFSAGQIVITDEIDVFWDKLLKYKDQTGNPIIKNILRFILNVLSLPHSNAECERQFSKVNIIKTKSRNH